MSRSPRRKAIKWRRRIAKLQSAEYGRQLRWRTFRVGIAPNDRPHGRRWLWIWALGEVR